MENQLLYYIYINCRKELLYDDIKRVEYRVSKDEINTLIMFTIFSIWLPFSGPEEFDIEISNSKRQDTHNLLFLGDAFRCARKSPWIWLPSQSWLEDHGTSMPTASTNHAMNPKMLFPSAG